MNGVVTITATFDMLLWILYDVQWIAFLVMMAFIVYDKWKKPMIAHWLGFSMICEVFSWIKIALS
jgi:hypothetical protein